MPTPVGAIFLIGFGHGLHGSHQSAMQLGGGQFWASYLIPCSISVWVRGFDPIELGVFEAELTMVDGKYWPNPALARQALRHCDFRQTLWVLFLRSSGPWQTRQRFK